MDLANAILAYAMAGAFVLWLIGEDREGGSRLLGLVSATIVALLFLKKDPGHEWWISGFVSVVLAAVGLAMAIALLGPIASGPRP